MTYYRHLDKALLKVFPGYVIYFVNVESAACESSSSFRWRLEGPSPTRQLVVCYTALVCFAFVNILKENAKIMKIFANTIIRSLSTIVQSSLTCLL